jgi:hypothetical protein
MQFDILIVSPPAFCKFIRDRSGQIFINGDLSKEVQTAS